MTKCVRHIATIVSVRQTHQPITSQNLEFSHIQSKARQRTYLRNAGLLMGLAGFSFKRKRERERERERQVGVWVEDP
jgi:hypothetical protein